MQLLDANSTEQLRVSARMTLDAICGDFTWLRQIGEGRTEGKPWEKKLGFARAVTAAEEDTSK